MPKVRKRSNKQSVPERGAQAPGRRQAHAPTNCVVGRGVSLPPPSSRATRSFLSPAVSGPQNLVFPVLVALACWGMVGYFLLLTTDANHLLFAGMAGVMALLWSFSVGIRIRKLLQRRRSSPRGRRDQIYRVPE